MLGGPPTTLKLLPQYSESEVAPSVVPKVMEIVTCWPTVEGFGVTVEDVTVALCATGKAGGGGLGSVGFVGA
jgi:hypothetical protein